MHKASLQRWLWLALAILAGLWILVPLFSEASWDWLGFLHNPDTHPGIFILMMILLPILGFPIIPFLLLAGIKFGPCLAVGISVLIISFHLVVSYLLTHSFFHQQISRLLARMNYQIPEVSVRRQLLFSIIFMALPGLPYTVKNFTLAILNIPFLIFFPVGLLCNVTLALPFIFFGPSLFDDPKLSLLLLAVIAGGYALSLRLKRKFNEKD
ncbi:TVP38/TMEM64 family protein [Geopsychrobacter electrodiphilus]|uniref:TVP38/TMEM64 family protein n=1 Tax=Geopsychrobacter electrodiphilus TaxID=225196 RepID=UPI00037FDC68|nr:hypothetical protein [Geopsychrobacter electrodiphilus]